MKTARFCIQLAWNVDAKTAVRNFKKKKLELLKRGKKESRSDTEYRLFYWNTILFAKNLLFYMRSLFHQT